MVARKIDEWELGDKQLEVYEEKELGRGAFAIVFEGKLVGKRPMENIMPSSLKISERTNQVDLKLVSQKISNRLTGSGKKVTSKS